MKTRPVTASALVPLVAFSLVGCGHPEFEWSQKLREIEGLNARLARAANERRQGDEAAARANEDIAQLKVMLAAQQRAERGGDQQASAERAALELRLIEEMSARSASLRKALGPLATKGVSVGVRRNRLSILVLADGLFDGNRNDLAAHGRETLRSIAAAIAADPALAARNFTVVGHTDVAAGREEASQAKTAARAQAVREFIVGKRGGLSPSRWAAVGRGALEPLSVDDSPEAKARNRRVELVLDPESLELPDYAKMVP